MSFPYCMTSSSRPRWDGNCILFEIDDVGEALCLTATDLLACFHIHRLRIEAIAWAKARARPARTMGRLNLWAADMDDLPPSGIAGACRLEAFRMSA